MSPDRAGPDPRDPRQPPAHRPPATVILIGLRGAGKTSVARALAAVRALPCIDLDDLVALRAGHATVGQAFSALGEPAFRQLEVLALRDALAGPPCVLSLGGGTPTAPGAADMLRAATASRACEVLYLRAAPDTLRARLAATDLSVRPALTPDAPNSPAAPSSRTLAEIDTVFAQRDPLYLALATRVIETDSLTIAQASALASA